jgi:hypothetical protein
MKLIAYDNYGKTGDGFMVIIGDVLYCFGRNLDNNQSGILEESIKTSHLSDTFMAYLMKDSLEIGWGGLPQYVKNSIIEIFKEIK